jgi:hypothetical protein
MSFADFIKTTVLLCAGAATTLAAVTVLSAAAERDAGATTIAFIWWAVAAVVGVWLGARPAGSPAIARLLGRARSVSTIPEQRPGLIMLSRLWLLLVSTLLAGVLAVLTPEIPGIAAGFALLSALGWRNQYAAVLAVEGRDGVRFYVDRTSPWKPITLTRTPGFKVYRPTQ